MKRLFAALLFLSSCHRAEAQPPAAMAQPPSDEIWLTPKQIAEAKIEVAPLAEQDVDDKILTSGRIAFDDLRVSHIYSPVTGKVSKISASVGDRVKHGDTLALIESPDVGIASADLSKAQADFVAAEHDYLREKALWEKPDGHATTKKDLEQAEDSWSKAKAELSRAKQKAFLLGGGGGVSQTFALRSGIDGEVIGRTISPNVEVQGQYGGGNAVELFTVGELDHVWLMADVYEMDFARVKVGSRVSMKVIAYPKRSFEGKVEWVSGALDPATRTAKIRCSFDNADRALKPEMYATVQISVEERKALAIPRNAFFRLGDTTVVYVESGKTDDGRTRFRRVPVTVDDEGEGQHWLVLKRGPDKGTRIVVSGGILLTGSE
jgi:cobalt-zinc-cadmium efflux system membrane fusion protein